jgi:hypothetical protein
MLEDNESSDRRPRDVTKSDLQTQTLTERQHLENKAQLIEVIRQNLAEGTVVVNITDWLKGQFVVSRNNEKLHAELLRSSGFFDFFPGLKEWSAMNQFLRNNFGGVGYTTTLLLQEPAAGEATLQEVQLTFNLLELKKLADQYHTQANSSITKGDMISESISLAALVNTFSVVFVDAIPR